MHISEKLLILAFRKMAYRLGEPIFFSLNDRFTQKV